MTLFETAPSLFSRVAHQPASSCMASTHLTRVTALPVRSDDSPTLASRALRERRATTS